MITLNSPYLINKNTTFKNNDYIIIQLMGRNDDVRLWNTWNVHHQTIYKENYIYHNPENLKIVLKFYYVILWMINFSSIVIRNDFKFPMKTLECPDLILTVFFAYDIDLIKLIFFKETMWLFRRLWIIYKKSHTTNCSCLKSGYWILVT